MKVRKSSARRLTGTQLEELWLRWRAGQSLSEIGRALDVTHHAVREQLVPYGGISPPPRRRKASSLSFAEREEVSRGLSRGDSLRAIGRRLGRSPSTVSREVIRNGGRTNYRAAKADVAAGRRARRPKLCKLALLTRLRRIVAVKLSLNWSPEQISGWLRLRFPTDDKMQISHETIYRSLFIQARGVLKKELRLHLRTRRSLRRARNATYTYSPRRHGIVDAVSISARPAEIEDRAVPGHWEGDLLAGANDSCIATLVERQSRYTMLVKLTDKHTVTVVAALKKQITKLPTELRRSLTWDRGMELANHKQFTMATDVAVYFCDPRSPWQRGTNENTNGLLRQYYPDGTNLTLVTQTELNAVARELNQRPRKTLGFETPAKIFSQSVALTD